MEYAMVQLEPIRMILEDNNEHPNMTVNHFQNRVLLGIVILLLYLRPVGRSWTSGERKKVREEVGNKEER